MTVYRYILITLTFCLGATILLGAGFALPWIVREILHPTGSFGALINDYVARLVATAIAVGATLELVFLGVLVSQHWIHRSVGVGAMLTCGTIALLSLLAIFNLQR